MRSILRSIGRNRSAYDCFSQAVNDENASPELLQKLISILIVTIGFDRREAEHPPYQAADGHRHAVNA